MKSYRFIVDGIVDEDAEQFPTRIRIDIQVRGHNRVSDFEKVCDRIFAFFDYKGPFSGVWVDQGTDREEMQIGN